MNKQNWLWSSIVFLPLLIGDATTLASGPRESNDEQAESLTQRMLSITSCQNLTRDQSGELAQLTKQLRSLGPTGLIAALKSREAAARGGTTEHQLGLIDQQLDIIAGQQQARTCQLFWYKSLAAAKAQSIELKRPILSLRLLGNLDQDLSCANSRFFRQVLYANPQIANTLRQQFILHWQPVRDVPIATIDFGDGRKLRQPIIGNSVHLVLTKEGRVIDALPGLVTPTEFARWTKSVSQLHSTLISLPKATCKQHVQLWHSDRAQRRRRQSDLTIEPNQAVSDLNPIDPRWKNAVKQLSLTANVTAENRLQKEAPNAAAAMRLAPLKMAAELPVLRMVESLESRVQHDSFFNLYGLQPKLDDWYTRDMETGDYDKLTHRIYKELFLMPLNDPWLGLSPDDRYIALEHRGRHGDETPNIPAKIILHTSAN